MSARHPAPLWRIKRFCGPKGLNIRYLGKSTLKALYDAGLVTDIPDVYGLPYKLMQVAAVQVNGRRIGRDKACAIARAVNGEKKPGLTVLLHALIPHVSWDACRSVSVRAKDLKGACRLTRSDLVQCPGIGPAVADAFLGYLSSIEAKSLADALAREGVDASSPYYCDPDEEEILI